MEVWVINTRPGARPLVNDGLRLGESWFRPRFFYVAFVVALIANVVANSVWVANSLDGLKDLDSFLHSGAAYARDLDPYGYYGWLEPPPISHEALNLNPPVSVYLFEPMSHLDRGVLGTAFLVGSIAMVGLSAGLLMRAYPDKRNWLIVLVVLAMAGMWQMLFYLQIYAPLLLATTVAWLLMRRGDLLLAGILMGVVVAIKPNYAIVPLVLLAAGHYRPGLAAIATAGLISLVPLAIDGPAIYREWLHMTLVFDGYEWTSNASLVSVGERLNLGPSGQVAGGLLACVVLVLVRKLRPGVMDATALALLTVILVGPVSWAGYTLLLLPYLFSIKWDGWAWASVVILVMPFAPEPAIASFGIDLPTIFERSSDGGGSSILSLPKPLVAVLSAVVLPLIGGIYAWGVTLLLVRLVQRLSAEREFSLTENLKRLPRPRRTARPVRVVRPRPLRTPVEEEPRTTRQPATVSIPYDA